MPDEPPSTSINRELTSTIVGAYVRKNKITSDQLPTLISTVHQALVGLGKPAAQTEGERTPAVPIRRSFHHDYIVCLECGWRGLTLRRHLSSRHGLSGDQYRARWNLPREHPLTAPSYSERRSGLAKELGLGRGRRASREEPKPAALGGPAVRQPRFRRRGRLLAVALANGASSIVMVRSVEEALAFRDAGIGQMCMGEVGGKAPADFDFGNSPFEISGVDFGGKTIIQRTSAGTQGIVAASKADRLYAASLVTAEATVRALISVSPDQVSLVAIGDNGMKRTDEDELCAMHLRNRLEGRPGDPEAIRRLILAGGEVHRFHDPARPYLHPEDVDIALDIDRYEFAIRVEFEDGRPVARMERPAATVADN